MWYDRVTLGWMTVFAVVLQKRMNVIIFKLDNPGNAHEWWVKDFRIKALDDIEQLMGFCGEHLYAEIYHVDADDSLTLVNTVKDCLAIVQPQTAKDTIMRLFKLGELYGQN